jgi:hypothetical protein
MQGRSQNRQQYSVACSCGANFSLDARGFGKPRPCSKCGATVTVAWGRDPKSGRTVPVAMTQKKAAPKASAGPSAPAVAPAAPSPVQDTVNALCSCGNSKRVPARQKSSPPRCVQCGRIMRIEDVPLDRPKGKIEKFERAKPSAPLLPLHLRAPLRVRIRKDAQFFDCVCGERVLIRAGSEGRPIQCHGCDRFHTLEIEGAAPPPGPVAESGAKPRGALPAPSRPLLLGEFLCKCGEIQPPRTSRTGKTFECKKCGRKGNVEIEKDGDGKVTMKPVFTFEPPPGKPAAAAAGPAKPGAPAPAPAGPAAPAWTCTCGQTVEVHAVMSKGSPACPACGRKIRMEKLQIPGTTRTLIRPVFADPVPRPAAARKEEGVVSFEELPPVSIPQAPSFAETAIFETAAGSDSSDDVPPPVAADAQIAICECSAEILVSLHDVGSTIQCPACADVMTVEQTADPRTKRPILSIRRLGTLDDADWKLDDFQ